MGLIITLIVGAIVGWLASLVMKTDAQQGALANVVIGVVGAFLGRWLLGDVLGIGGATNAGDLSLVGIFWGVIGAVILVAILKFFNVMGKN